MDSEIKAAHAGEIASQIGDPISDASALNSFRKKYPSKPPRKGKDDELRQITSEEGLEEFNSSLGAKALKSDLPRSVPRGNVYLWVIGEESIPAALEAADVGKSLSNGVIKHTNLTGGAAAHCGGEVWFIEDRKIILNGASGRYGPPLSDDTQIFDAGHVFKEQGYQVAVLHLDESGHPATVLVGEPKWL